MTDSRMSNAARQSRYRRKALGDGRLARLDMLVSATAKAELQELSDRYGVTQREAVELALSRLLESCRAKDARSARKARVASGASENLSSQIDLEDYLDALTSDASSAA